MDTSVTKGIGPSALEIEVSKDLASLGRDAKCEAEWPDGEACSGCGHRMGPCSNGAEILVVQACGCRFLLCAKCHELESRHNREVAETHRRPHCHKCGSRLRGGVDAWGRAIPI